MRFDTLTGLPHVSLLPQRLQQLLQSPGAEHGRIAAVLLASEGGETLARQHGVRVAQQLSLQLVSRLLREVSGDGNVFQCGNERFLVLLVPVADLLAARAAAAAICARVGGSYLAENRFVRVQMRYGVTLLDDTGIDLDTLLERLTSDLDRPQ